MLTAFQTLMSRLTHPALKEKLKLVIQLIVSVSWRKQPGGVNSFTLNTAGHTRLEPIKTKLPSAIQKQQVKHHISLKDNAEDIPISYKSSIVLPPLQHIKN